MTDQPDDPFDDEEFRRFADEALRELIPKVDASAFSMALVPSTIEKRTDIKFCVELGAMIMLDKPIIGIVLPGAPAPDKLVLVADELVEMDVDDQIGTSKRVAAAIQRVMTKYGLNGE